MAADIIPTPDEDQPETPAEQEERIRWEAAVIARAREQAAAGDVIDGDALFAWFDALEEDENAPFPEPRTPATRPHP